jgi:hypothetical protein
MSTKRSIKFEHDRTTGQRFHLYEEVLEPDQIYLEVIGVPFEVASSVELSGTGPNRVVIRLPEAWARKLGLLAGEAP